MAAMRWLAPVWCALYVCAKAENFAGIRKSVRAVFTLAVPVVAIYGIDQFISILPWDAYFMKEGANQQHWLSRAFPGPCLRYDEFSGQPCSYALHWPAADVAAGADPYLGHCNNRPSPNDAAGGADGLSYSTCRLGRRWARPCAEVESRLSWLGASRSP